MSETKSLGESLPDEIARVTAILGYYVEIGPAGVFGAATIRADLDRATRSLLSGDLVEMIRSYEALREISG